MSMHRMLVGLCVLGLMSVCVCGQELLKDPGFATLGAAGSPWQVQLQPDGAAMPGARLKAAQLSQAITLPAGLFELTVQARGQGELLLRVQGVGERTQPLAKDAGTYGYLFEAEAKAATVTLGVSGEGQVTNAVLLAATDEQKQAWAKQQASFQQFGWFAFNAQRPTPGSAEPAFTGDGKPLAAMTQRVVLDEPRLNTAHVEHGDRLVAWLGSNGFDRLDGEKLPVWTSERIQRGDAYGSVMVLGRGVSPVKLAQGPHGKPLWLEYLRAGGRIVNAGCMPFVYVESPRVEIEPTPSGSEQAGPDVIGLGYGWNSPYCGQGSLPVTPTPQGKAWGLENSDSPITGVPIENTSFAFGTYTVPATGKQGAAHYFRNVRPDLPWSGVVKILQYVDFNNDTALRDVWRAALYVGQSITNFPPLPPPMVKPIARLKLVAAAGGMKGRHEFVRGEKVAVEVLADATLKAAAVRLELARDGKALLTEERPVTDGKAAFALDTAPYAFGAYTLTAAALTDGKAVETAEETLGIRYIPPEAFNWEVWQSAGSNPLRADMEFADIAAAGMELYLVSADVVSVDTAIRHGLGFSLRAHPDFSGGKTWDYAKEPEYFRIDTEGKPVGTAYSGGRPSVGISHPAVRSNAVESLRRAVAEVAGIPAFRPYVLCNDDFSIYYGWDYAPHVLAAFKKDTGLEAPRKMVKPEKPGPIPDNQPWLKWFEWTLINVDGAFNKAETEGVVQARADARIGPIPGGMQIPLVSMWEPAQYPPYNFGKNGFNLLCFYYYNTYWQPVMTITFWNEIGRMGNRDLPQWTLPDAFMTAGYTRNSLYHYFAGGVRGLAYFTYSSRNENSWAEFRRLGPVVRRIGPVQARLTPARRDIGLLNSFTSNCFDPGHTLTQVYAYHNLMQGHFDVEMVSEDEILTGRADQYKAILLYFVQYLRQPVYDALAAHAAKGGLVLLDSTVPFDIPGAKRLGVDVGMGKEQTKGMPPEGAHLSVPGLRDYGIVERVAFIRKVLSEHIRPRFECDDIKLVATRFEADGVPYTWFVNVHDGKEYMFCRERMGAGHPGSGTPEKIKELRDWEEAETAKGPYISRITMDKLPGVPYDLVGGKEIPVNKTADGRVALTVSMERFGGTLVIWLPERIASLKMEVPRTVRPGETLKASAVLHGKGGFLGLRAGHRIPGVLPIEFVLKDPKGKDSIVSGVRATRDGTATWEWTPAMNDLAGEWTLTAKELMTGKSAVTAIDLK